MYKSIHKFFSLKVCALVHSHVSTFQSSGDQNASCIPAVCCVVVADRDVYDHLQNVASDYLHGPRLRPPWETGARCSRSAWGQGSSALPLKFVVPDFVQGLLGNCMPLVRRLCRCLCIMLRWGGAVLPALSYGFPLTSALPPSFMFIPLPVEKSLLSGVPACGACMVGSLSYSCTPHSSVKLWLIFPGETLVVPWRPPQVHECSIRSETSAMSCYVGIPGGFFQHVASFYPTVSFPCISSCETPSSQLVNLNSSCILALQARAKGGL